MFCKVCNTRFEPGARACPNCGAATSRPTTGTSPTSRKVPLAESTALDLELDEVLEQAGVDPMDQEEKEEAPSQPAEPLSVTARKRSEPRRAPAADTAPLAIDSAGMRMRIAEEPELIEPGLRVFNDEKGKPVGVGYATAVGSIDLLARDRDGVPVVVMVAEPDAGDELVAEMLQRVGWVRKHLAKKSEQPRGIVLLESAPESLGYAAAAVTDTIRFKTYQIALTIRDLEF